MSAYHQMGNDSENLVNETDLKFSGIVLSPVNRKPSELINDVTEFKSYGNFSFIFDPQLYFPRTERGTLKLHGYFPRDIDTADISSLNWWMQICNKLIDYTSVLEIDYIASPAILPKIFSPEYYSSCNIVNAYLSNLVKSKNIQLLLTVLVQHNQLSSLTKVLEICSSLSTVESDGFYIVLENDIAPRFEFKDPEVLAGMMQMIKELKNLNKPIFFSHCSSDMILAKYAGADHCATGKFFNLRRFTKSRYGEDEGGGGQLPYFFADGLLSFIREADYQRIKEAGLESFFCSIVSENYWHSEIEKNFSNQRPKPWIGLGWRQYMSWFAKAERLLENNPLLAEDWIKQAGLNWKELQRRGVFMDERTNNGSWINMWQEAISLFKKQNT